MSIKKRSAHSLGTVYFPKYKSKRSFSFPPYFDPNHIKFGNLHTLNDDTTDPGFSTEWHQHKYMNIFGIVLKGTCYHKDSLGNQVEVAAGSVQRRSIGRTDGYNRLLRRNLKP